MQATEEALKAFAQTLGEGYVWLKVTKISQRVIGVSVCDFFLFLELCLVCY